MLAASGTLFVVCCSTYFLTRKMGHRILLRSNSTLRPDYIEITSQDTVHSNIYCIPIFTRLYNLGCNIKETIYQRWYLCWGIFDILLCVLGERNSAVPAKPNHTILLKMLCDFFCNRIHFLLISLTAIMQILHNSYQCMYRFSRAQQAQCQAAYNTS